METYIVAVWVILVMCQTCAYAGIIAGKGFVCQDPDTGKLHALNTTWPSQSFCGNYTCKLRKRNTTDMEHSPTQNVISITTINRVDTDRKTETDKNNSVTIDSKTDSDTLSVLHKEIPKMNMELETLTDDRYLTEDEIKTISQLLHTVKKSDLEAIVEIYNLAQDIYKEIDKVTTENLIKDQIENKDKVNEVQNAANTRKTYWYEPNIHNGIKSSTDLTSAGSSYEPTRQPLRDTYPSYFRGPLTNQDFGKLPYYYPMSTFQRQASYVFPRPNPQSVPPNTPCRREYTPSPWVVQVANNVEHQKMVNPSYALPYPFSYMSYNYSYPSYYYSYPYTSQPYVGTYVANTYDNSDEVQDIEQEPVKESNFLEKLLFKSAEPKKLGAWHTDSLSSNVLDEVKANILDKSNLLKALPFRKKVKLEKVGKVIKLDELDRSRRSIDSSDEDEDQFEAVIERVTCDSFKPEPGYFRVGNLTQPFPDCCPQKMEKITLNS